MQHFIELGPAFSTACVNTNMSLVFGIHVDILVTKDQKGASLSPIVHVRTSRISQAHKRPVK